MTTTHILECLFASFKFGYQHPWIVLDSPRITSIILPSGSSQAALSGIFSRRRVPLCVSTPGALSMKMAPTIYPEYHSGSSYPPSRPIY